MLFHWRPNLSVSEMTPYRVLVLYTCSWGPFCSNHGTAHSGESKYHCFFGMQGDCPLPAVFMIITISLNANSKPKPTLIYSSIHPELG